MASRATEAELGSATLIAPSALGSSVGEATRRQLARGFIVEHQRTRLIKALAAEIVDKGYREVTVAGIVKRAGVARNTFYESFASKEECFLAASNLAGEEAMRCVAAAVRSATPEWSRRVGAGVRSFLSFAASESDLARVFIVESLSAGPAAADRYERTVRAIVPLLRVGRRECPQGDRLPPTLEETVIGGIFWVVYQRIVLGQSAELEGASGELIEFALTPYIGPQAAKRVAEE